MQQPPIDDIVPARVPARAEAAWAHSPGPSSAAYPARIAVRTRDRIVIVPTADIVRIDAEGNRVRLWTCERSWIHRDTLVGIAARLDPEVFVRVHRSYIVRLDAITELVPLAHGEFCMRLVNGSELTSGRLYREVVRQALAIA
jgi:two-component system LytT family response regulator